MARKERYTAAALRERCEAYFAQCDEAECLYGEAGLALSLQVSLSTLRDWYDGRKCPALQEETQRAYLRIQSQLEASPAYMGKGMVSKAVFLMKQPRLGGYQDRAETRQEMTVEVKMGGNMDRSDFA